MGVELGLSALKRGWEGSSLLSLLPALAPRKRVLQGEEARARTLVTALTLEEGSGWKGPPRGRKQSQQGWGDRQG